MDLLAVDGKNVTYSVIVFCFCYGIDDNCFHSNTPPYIQIQICFLD